MAVTWKTYGKTYGKPVIAVTWRYADAEVEAQNSQPHLGSWKLHNQLACSKPPSCTTDSNDAQVWCLLDVGTHGEVI